MAVGPGIGAIVDIAAVKQGVVLAVGHDQLAEALGLLHGPAHHIPVLHALPVIGKGHYIGGHGLQLRQRLPHPNHRVMADGLQLRLKMLQAVRHRVQVRHGAHSRIATVSRRKGAGANGLFIRKTRFPKMYMNINETG